RDIESEVLDDLTRRHRGVIATGGGSVLRAINRERLHERGRVFYLRSLPEDVFRRLRHDRTRPLLQVSDPLKRLRDLFEVRDPLYRNTAHHVIETARPTVGALVQLIMSHLELSSEPDASGTSSATDAS
ncbi:MAG: Shikimate kinase 1, partial [Pseudomonadota bacterium]